MWLSVLADSRFLRIEFYAKQKFVALMVLMTKNDKLQVKLKV